ncbi:MAG: hypothetical protein PHY92_04360 [Alphaproteobacteria bacterium]|nr:hypothetical protein [Alphaproteobacteria bacterium]
MNELFQQLLNKLSIEDRALLQDAASAAQTAEQYRARSHQGASPDSKTIEHANAMRVVQLGEAIKNLNWHGVLDRETNLAPDISARDIAAMRDTFAHPEKHMIEQSYEFVGLCQQAESVLNKLNSIARIHPDNSDIRDGIDALCHLSNPDKPSPLVWEDAINYMQVLVGGYLEKLSKQGLQVLNSRSDGLYEKILYKRHLLCHKYRRHGLNSNITFSFDNLDLKEVLRADKALLRPGAYEVELFGDRPEPELRATIYKWMNPDKKGTPQKWYSVGCRFVAEEISRLAKEGAPQTQIWLLNEALETARKSEAEIQKFMEKHFPDGLSPQIMDSFNCLDEKAREDFWMDRKKITTRFEEALKVITGQAERKRGANLSGAKRRKIRGQEKKNAQAGGSSNGTSEGNLPAEGPRPPERKPQWRGRPACNITPSV